MATINQLTNYSPEFMGWDVNVVRSAMNELMTPAIVQPSPLKNYSKLFSNMTIPSGIVNVPIQTWTPGAQDLSNGVTVNTASATSAQLTVNKDVGNFYQFNPAEVQQYGLTYAIDTWLQPAIFDTDRYIASQSLALILNPSNFASASIKFTNSASFTPAAVGGLNAALSKQGINGRRFAVLCPDYFYAAQSSVAVLGNQAGADAIYNTVNGIYRMDLMEGQDLPDITGIDTSLTASVVGFSGNSAGLAVATALPPVLHPTGEMFPYTSPWTGVTYLVEKYYDEHARKQLIGASVLYDMQKVQNTIRVLYSK